ncbi:hypothetical protein D9K79_03635 [Acinetobacter cumulans]|uniref:Uncharacterized protein n=1 Tax=Acinetobacter cumulans TaxID=2136182 RepID=A0ABX9U8Z4_9GAMM|nr:MULTISPECIES: hypothetical protein [Acinetobacter]NWK73991.1 hypothetical protein [Acinetobacter sp. SwsAc6]RLL49070.1 hypothetical protein D9K79_03635 [Acinetobacter cumulans]
MKTKNNRLKGNTVFGFVVGLLGIACGLWLLIFLEKISGAEFVAFSFGFAVIGLIIAFAAEVQEFSIAGNGVKLKELRSEAEKTIEELKEARTVLFRILVEKSINNSGGFGSNNAVDERVDHFLNLVNDVEKFDVIDDLKSDLSRALNIIMVGQYNELCIIHKEPKKVGDDFSNSDKPHFLYIALNDEVIKLYKGNQTPVVDFDTKKSEIMGGLEAYSKLYAIKVKLDKLETDNA